MMKTITLSKCKSIDFYKGYNAAVTTANLEIEKLNQQIDDLKLMNSVLLNNAVKSENE